MFSPYLIPYLISLALSTGVGLYAWRRRDVRGAASFALYALAEASMTLGYVFELPSASLQAKIFWDNTQFVGELVAPLAMLAFALQYTGRKLSHPKRFWGTLALVSLVSLLLVFTDNWHGWVRPAAWLVPGEPFSALIYDFSPSFWVMAIYAYVLNLSGLFILAREFIHPQRLYRAQVGTILIGALVPMAGSVLTLLDITLTFQRDTTPLTFAIGNLVIAWGLFRYRLFDVVPVARDRVIESMGDIVVVLDAHSRVVDLNPAAQEVIGRAASDLIGQPSAQVFSHWPELVEQFQGVKRAHTEIAVGAGESQRHFGLSLSPLHDQQGRFLGRLGVVRDITVRKKAEAVLQRAHDDLERQVEIRTAELSRVNASLKAEIAERMRAEHGQRATFEEMLKATRALGESEAALRALINAIPEPAVLIDPAGIVLVANNMLAQRVNSSVDELVGNCLYDYISPGVAEHRIAHIKDVIRTGKPARFEDENAGRHYINYVYPVSDATGSVLRVAIFALNISERVRAEDALHLYAERLKVLLEIDQGILAAQSPGDIAQVALDHIQQLIPCQGAYITLLDFAADEALVLAADLDAASQLKVGDRLPLKPFAETLYAQAEHAVIGVPLVFRDELIGSLNLIQTDPDAFTQEYKEIAREVADQLAIAIQQAQLNEQVQRHAEELEQRVIERTAELQAANARLQSLSHKEEEARIAAEQANQAKSEFLSNMSHELRTPLNGILGYAQILKRDSSLNPQQLAGLNIIQQSGEHLLTLINDILDLSKIEARKLELYPTDVHLQSFLDGIVGAMRMRVQQKNLLFYYKADDGLPSGVQADAQRLRQILINLLGNASKFTEKGSVTLQVGFREQEPERACSASGFAPGTIAPLRFQVIDTGVGMTPEHKDKIFLPFEQVGEAHKRAGGTGLGLSISQRLAQAMGSEIQVESDLGRGSRFWFDVDLLATVAELDPQQGEAPRIVGYKGRRRKVLLVDDKVHNRLVLVNFLETLGFDVLEAENGMEGVQKAEQMPPDVLVADLVMPVMNGFEMVQRIRQTPALQDMLIIAVSASIIRGEKEQSIAAGCDAFLPKPIDVQELLALLETHLGLEWQCEESPPEIMGAEIASPLNAWDKSHN